jgi:hypothetical protein
MLSQANPLPGRLDQQLLDLGIVVASRKQPSRIDGGDPQTALMICFFLTVFSRGWRYWVIECLRLLS